MSLVRTFADDPANSGAIARASKRTVLDEHLREAEEFAKRVTKGASIERLKEMFGQ